MRKGFTVLVAAAAVALAAVALVPAAGGSPASTSATKRVSIRDNFFSPRAVTVRRGGRVRWTWRGSNPHNVTFTKVPRGGSRKGAGTRTRGRFTRSFGKRGLYRYVCTIHAGMRGSVNVR